MNELDRKLEKSKMWSHARAKHNGRVPDFQMNVKGMYGNDCMLRQIGEAVRIKQAGLDNLMNDRSEWGANKIPRLEIATED